VSNQFVHQTNNRPVFLFDNFFLQNFSTATVSELFRKIKTTWT